MIWRLAKVQWMLLTLLPIVMDVKHAISYVMLKAQQMNNIICILV